MSGKQKKKPLAGREGKVSLTKQDVLQTPANVAEFHKASRWDPVALPHRFEVHCYSICDMVNPKMTKTI